MAPAKQPHTVRPICDYEGSSYKEDFWTGQNREYEDLAERHALRHLLPKTSGRLLEIGAGFGRLANLYTDYPQIVLLDYSRTLLQQAQQAYGADTRFTFAAADLYNLPFASNSFDLLVMVRVIHHLADVPAALQELSRVLSPGGQMILEFANKRNLKTILRYLLGQQRWSPFAYPPYEFARLHFDFHPAWMRMQLAAAGFQVEQTRTLSHFRIAPLKRRIPYTWLARADALIQPSGALWQLSPSVMLSLRKIGQPAELAPKPIRCLACGGDRLHAEPAGLRCADCDRLWPITDGVLDFKS